MSTRDPLNTGILRFSGVNCITLCLTVYRGMSKLSCMGTLSCTGVKVMCLSSSIQAHVHVLDTAKEIGSTVGLSGMVGRNKLG